MDGESTELFPEVTVNDVLEFNGGKSFASSTVIIQLPLLLLLFVFFIPRKNKTEEKFDLIIIKVNLFYQMIIFHLVVVH